MNGIVLQVLSNGKQVKQQSDLTQRMSVYLQNNTPVLLSVSEIKQLILNNVPPINWVKYVCFENIDEILQILITNYCNSYNSYNNAESNLNNSVSWQEYWDLGDKTRICNENIKLYIKFITKNHGIKLFKILDLDQLIELEIPFDLLEIYFAKSTLKNELLQTMINCNYCDIGKFVRTYWKTLNKTKELLECLCMDDTNLTVIKKFKKIIPLTQKCLDNAIDGTVRYRNLRSYNALIKYILDNGKNNINLTKDHMLKLVPLGRMYEIERKLYTRFLNSL